MTRLAGTAFDPDDLTMFILGLRETLQLIDGSGRHAVVQALAGIEDPILFAAPALAYAADAIAGGGGADRLRLDNALEEILLGARRAGAPGLTGEVAHYTVFPFGLAEVRAFSSIRAAASGEGALELQLLAIASVAGLPVLVERRPEASATFARLAAAGIHVGVRWV